MPKCKDVIKIMETIAPERIAYSWDNPGLMTGDPDSDISKILVALDCCDEVIDEAAEFGANMIITHHPLIFRPIRNVTKDSRTGHLLIRLIENRINLYSAHTNLDMSPIGTNAELAKRLMLQNTEYLMPTDEEPFAMGRVGDLPEKMSTEEFAAFVKERLGLNTIAFSKAGDYVSKVGLCTGHGCDREFLEAAIKKGCDGFVSGDVGYHEAQEAISMGISLFDGTHFATEVIVTDPLTKYLREKLDGVEIRASEKDANTLEFV